MVARLKLKEIDGRAPPGVKPTSIASSAPDQQSPPIGGAIHPNCEKFPEAQNTPLAR